MARALERNNLINSLKFKNYHQKLYNSSLEEQAERYSALTQDLTGEIKFFSSPGRVELIGNHTDHNNGLVLAATIDLDTVAAVTKTNDNFVVINSFGYPSVKVNINELEVNKQQYGTSDALVKGLLKGYKDKGLNIGGFVANTCSNIFKGAGVSSSAAFELLLCEILNVLYNDTKIDVVTKAIISQFAENVYFGKPSGLMDQLTISRGGVSLMDFKNILMPNSASVEWPFEELALIIINCGGDHCNLTSEYAEIREDMKKISNAFGKQTLREVSKEEFYSKISFLNKDCGGRAILRAKHYFEENNRVRQALEAIKQKDMDSFIDCINQSGTSSYEQLQNCYAKNDSRQNVPLGLQMAKKHAFVKANRVHGGGFAGTILIMLNKQNAQDFKSYMTDLFGEENIFMLSIRSTGTTLVEV